MNINAYQEMCKRTDNYGTDQREQLINYTLGLAGETGELVESVKKYLYHDHPLKSDKVVEELGDILWYVAELASNLGIKLQDVAFFNIHKLENRYPAKFNAADSVNRKERMCSACGEPQFMTPSGVTCPNGHGGADAA